MFFGYTGVKANADLDKVAANIAASLAAATLAESDAAAALIAANASNTFLQTGVGAVARTSQSKAREVISVTDFGPLGNGVADDATAFQRAINAVPDGGVLWIPPAPVAWMIGTELTAARAITLLGFGLPLVKALQGTVAGVGTITISGGLGVGVFTASQAGKVAVNDVVYINGIGHNVSAFNGTTGITLSNLVHATYSYPADGTYTFTISRPGLNALFSATDIDNVSVEGIRWDGNTTARTLTDYRANTRSPANLKVLGCYGQNTRNDWSLTYAGFRAIAVNGQTGSTTHRPTNVQFLNNTLENIRTYGILPFSCDNVRTLNNKIVYPTTEVTGLHGMGHVDCSHIVCVHNDVQNATYSGIEVGAQSRYITVVSNDLHNCGGDACMSIESISTVLVCSNNRITDALVPAINVSYGAGGFAPLNTLVQNVRVENNSVRAKTGVAAASIGINVYSSTAPNIGIGVDVMGNTIDGFKIGGVLSYLTFSSFRNNTVLNLQNVAGSCVVQLVFCTYSDADGNKCNSITNDHAIQFLDYAGNHCDFCSASNNKVLQCGPGNTKSLVHVEGATSNYQIHDNICGGCDSYVHLANAGTTLSLQGMMGGAVSGLTTGAAPYIVQGHGNYTDLRIIMDNLQVVGRRLATVNPAASPNATDLASAELLVNELKTQFNQLLARLNSSTGHGLIT